MKILSILAAGFVFLASPSLAASIAAFSQSCWDLENSSLPSCDRMTKLDVLLEGKIIEGDAEKFERVIKTIGRKVNLVVLRSPGGSVSEAIKIGKIIRQLMIPTEAPNFYFSSEGPLCGESVALNPTKGAAHPEISCVCASACFLIYASGFPRNIAYVLLHRPFIEPSVNFNLSYDDSVQAAAAAKQKVMEYMQGMGIPGRYTSTMFSTPSNAAIHIPLEEMQNYISGYPPEVEEWLMSKCKTGTTGQIGKSFNELVKRGNNNDLMALTQELVGRDTCLENALEPKRQAVRLEYFGPLSTKELVEKKNRCLAESQGFTKQHPAVKFDDPHCD